MVQQNYFSDAYLKAKFLDSSAKLLFQYIIYNGYVYLIIKSLVGNVFSNIVS